MEEHSPATTIRRLSLPASGEYLIVDLRRHGLGLLGAAVRLLVVTALAGFLLGSVSGWLGDAGPLISPARWLIYMLAAVLVMVMVGRRFVRWSLMRAAVTNQRVAISYRLRKQGWDIPLLTIVDVTCRVGIVQRRFGTGSLVIQTNFAYLPAVIPDVPQIEAVREMVLAARAQAWTDYQWNLSGRPYSPDMRAVS